MPGSAPYRLVYDPVNALLDVAGFGQGVLKGVDGWTDAVGQYLSVGIAVEGLVYDPSNGDLVFEWNAGTDGIGPTAHVVAEMRYSGNGETGLLTHPPTNGTTLAVGGPNCSGRLVEFAS